METYEQKWQRYWVDKSRVHGEKVKSIEADPGSLLIKFLQIASIMVSVSAWIMLLMVPFSDAKLLHAAYLFVIGYVMGQSCKSLNDAYMSKAVALPVDYMGQILVHSHLIGEDLHEIKNLLKDRER